MTAEDWKGTSEEFKRLQAAGPEDRQQEARRIAAEHLWRESVEKNKRRLVTIAKLAGWLLLIILGDLIARILLPYPP